MDWQRIHIGAQSDHPTCCSATSGNNCNNTSPTNACDNLIATELSQSIRHDLRGAVNIKQQLRMSVETMSPTDGVVEQIFKLKRKFCHPQAAITP